MEGFEYETKIHDAISGPVAAEVAALSNLQAALGKADASLAQHAKAQAGAGQAAEHAGKSHKKSEGFLHDFSHSLIPEIALGELAAESIKKLGEVTFDLAKEGVEFALEAADFKEDTIAAYSAIYGSAEEGERAFGQIQEMAVGYHMKLETAGKLAQDLMLAGIEDKEALASVIAGVSNLQRIGLEGGAAKLTRIVEQSAAIGHFQLPRKLAGMGVSVESIVDELAKSLHKSTDVIKAELKAGKISTEAGVAAITNVINNGKIGQIAAKKFDLSDLMADWHNFWTKLFEDVNVEPLINSLRGFVGIFDTGTASGKTFHDTIVDAFNAIMRVGGEVIDWVTIFALKMTLGFEEGKYAARPLREEIQKMGLEGPNIRSVSEGARAIAKYATEAGIAVYYLAAALTQVEAAGEKIVSGGIASYLSLIGLGGSGGIGLQGSLGGGGGTVVAPAHAEGGRVVQPSPGEAFASVAPGESILPKDFRLTVPEINIPSSGGRGGMQVTWTGDLNVHEAVSAHEFRSIAQEEIADMFERVRDEVGGAAAST